MADSVVPAMFNSSLTIAFRVLVCCVQLPSLYKDKVSTAKSFVAAIKDQWKNKEPEDKWGKTEDSYFSALAVQTLASNSQWVKDSVHTLPAMKSKSYADWQYEVVSQCIKSTHHHL